MKRYIPSFSVAAVAAAFLAAAYRYPAQARAFPAAVGWVTIGFALLDFLMDTNTSIGRGIGKWLNPSIASAEGSYGLSAQAQAILWLVLFTAALVLMGILCAVPLYVFASLRWRGNRSWWKALLAAAIATAAVWLLFAVGLQLDLYRGYL